MLILELYKGVRDAEDFWVHHLWISPTGTREGLAVYHVRYVLESFTFEWRV